ncbi:MAG: hypothetical protein ACWGQW_24990, partial [bacterium]
SQDKKRTHDGRFLGICVHKKSGLESVAKPQREDSFKGSSIIQKCAACNSTSGMLTLSQRIGVAESSCVATTGCDEALMCKFKAKVPFLSARRV